MRDDTIEPKITCTPSGKWILIGTQIDKDKFVQQALGKCRTLSEKVYLLRGVVDLDNEGASKFLGVSPHTVENVVWRLRKKGLKIPDKRRGITADKLRERMREILGLVALERGDFV